MPAEPEKNKEQTPPDLSAQIANLTAILETRDAFLTESEKNEAEKLKSQINRLFVAFLKVRSSSGSDVIGEKYPYKNEQDNN